MEHIDTAKKSFSKLGLAGFVILGIGTLAQILVMGIAEVVFPQWAEHPWGMWLITFAPIYLVAVPLGLLIMRKAPAEQLQKRSLKFKTILKLVIISIFMMYAGNFAGTFINTLLQKVFGISAGNPVLNYAMDNAFLPKVLFIVILAPAIEEYVFRKQLIDRMHMYGEKLAVVMSALMFGLFHGNLAQLFYAFTLGLVFGYVYLRTGKLRYSIGLHMFINFVGSVIAPTFLEKLAVLDTMGSMETMDMAVLEPLLPWLAGFALYVIALLGGSVAGLVLVGMHYQKVRFNQTERTLPKDAVFKTAFLNAGMLLFMLCCLALIVASAILA